MGNPLSICMFSNLYAPVVSGSSTQTAALARELVRRGHQVTVITAKIVPTSPDYEQVDGVHIYRLPAIRLPRLPIALNFPWLSYTFTTGNLRRIERIIKQHEVDILHCHNHMFDLALSAVLMQKKSGKPLFVTIHTVIKHARSLYNLLLYPADRLLLKHLVINQANVLICPDANIVEYVSEAFGRVKTALIPYGISLPEEAVTPEAIEQLRAKYQLHSKRVILSLGHVHEIRNRKDLIEAFPAVLQAYPDTILLIAGTVATDFPGLLARRLGVADRVIFTGPVPYAEVPALLALADLEAHWLNQDEPGKTSLGIASLEAMAAGKVILAVANENTYGPGVLRNGENMLVVEPHNPARLAQTLIELLGDETRRRVIGLAARQTLKTRFSWDQVCASTVEVYERELAACQVPQLLPGM